VLTRLIPATQKGNATITVTRDPATTAANYPVGSVNVAVPVTLKQQQPPKITVDPKSITFDDKQPVGTSAKVAVSLEPAAPIGGQVVLDVSGTPNPFVPGGPFTVSTSTLVFKEGNKGPQEFEVVRLTPGEAAGSVTIKLNPALTTATNFLTADLSAVIPVEIKALLAEPAPSPPFFFDTSTGVISVQCPAANNASPIGLSFSALITVTDSSIPPISAQKFVSIKVE